MKNILDGSECIQYADNSTIYCSCKIKDRPKCTKDIEKELNKAASYLKDTKLVFNPSKTKVMIISPRQRSHYHHLGNTESKL